MKSKSVIGAGDRDGPVEPRSVNPLATSAPGSGILGSTTFSSFTFEAHEIVRRIHEQRSEGAIADANKSLLRDAVATVYT